MEEERSSQHFGCGNVEEEKEGGLRMVPPMGPWSTGSDSSGTLKGLRASYKSS